MQEPSPIDQDRHDDREDDDVASERDATWKLTRDDVFDRIRSDADLTDVVRRASTLSATPYADVLRRMLGMDDLLEHDAKIFFDRIVDHWRRLRRSLERTVHVRVAALDLLTMRPALFRRDSRPIVVTPSLIERAIEAASTDAVTGLPQRAHFMSLLRHELRQRKRREIAIVYLDLDNFKSVNDSFGHARGDEVLRMMAKAGRSALRHGDVLARIGGDEFAILFVDLRPDEAESVMRRLRQQFEALTGALAVSFSAGIALAESGELADELLARADAAMYRDKRERQAGASATSSSG